jgi:hypothetical protein
MDFQQLISIIAAYFGEKFFKLLDPAEDIAVFLNPPPRQSWLFHITAISYDGSRTNIQIIMTHSERSFFVFGRGITLTGRNAVFTLNFGIIDTQSSETRCVASKSMFHVTAYSRMVTAKIT